MWAIKPGQLLAWSTYVMLGDVHLKNFSLRNFGQGPFELLAVITKENLREEHSGLVIVDFRSLEKRLKTTNAILAVRGMVKNKPVISFHQENMLTLFFDPNPQIPEN